MLALGLDDSFICGIKFRKGDEYESIFNKSIYLFIRFAFRYTSMWRGTAPIATEAPTLEQTESPTEAVTETPVTTEEVVTSPMGSTLDNPVPVDGILTTPDWEVQVLEVLRGDIVTETLNEVSSFNDPHEDPNMEYMLVRLRVKYLGDDPTGHAYGKLFLSLGSAGKVYDPVSFIDVKVPQPELEADLPPGAETEGWVAIEVAIGETDIKLVVRSYSSYENNTAIFLESDPKWYISLE